jgi:hypothetical protein
MYLQILVVMIGQKPCVEYHFELAAQSGLRPRNLEFLFGVHRHLEIRNRM